MSIARVYPILYCVRSDNSRTEYLSEKQWEQRRRRNEARREEMLAKMESEQQHQLARTKQGERITITEVKVRKVTLICTRWHHDLFRCSENN